jgi:hypothetical protein
MQHKAAHHHTLLSHDHPIVAALPTHRGDEHPGNRPHRLGGKSSFLASYQPEGSTGVTGSHSLSRDVVSACRRASRLSLQGSEVWNHQALLNLRTVP